MSIARIIAVLLLLVATAWAAIINGQAFFMADTSAYVRGPDFAVVYFLGKKFESAWTQDQRVSEGAQTIATQATQAPLNAPLQKAVLGGRSIYYGALLYIGHLTSYFWLSIFLQAAIFLYLSYTFIVNCYRLSFYTYVLATSLTLILTPISFFVSFLMPDVFASFLILSVIILVVFWERISTRDKVLISLIALYSVLTHTSHLLLLLLTATALLVFRTLARGPQFSSKALKVLFAITLAGILGEFAFSTATKIAVGADPMRPPFAMARLIDDGPGYRYLQSNCASKTFVVCEYLDRLPTKSDGFLWSTDRTTGVYNVADMATRKALSAEQLSFVAHVFLFDPIGVIAALTGDSFEQLFKVGLDEFFYSRSDIDSYASNLPAYYASGLAKSRISSQPQLAAPFNQWVALFYFSSLFGLVLTLSIWPVIGRRRRFAVLLHSKALTVSAVVATALIFNAAICGALSGPHERYQTRIAWIPLFVLLVLGAKLWKNGLLNNYDRGRSAFAIDVNQTLTAASCGKLTQQSPPL